MVDEGVKIRRKILVDENRKTEVLRVPFYYQSDVDALCFVYSLKMCLDYYKNIYPKSQIREETPNMNVDEIKELTSTSRQSGTRVDGELMNKLERNIDSLKFALNEETSLETLKNKILNGYPQILLYDCSYMQHQIPGPGHAGVLIGLMENNDLILNNPWLGNNTLVEYRDFEPGWEIEYRRSVIVEPELQAQLEVEE